MTTASPRNRSLRSVARELIGLAAPVVGLNVLSVLALVVDTAMCGRLPDAELALTAMGFATQFTFLNMVVILGATVGTVAMVARSYGARRYARASEILSQSTQVTVLLAIGVAVIGNLAAPTILRFIGASDATLPTALSYVRPILVGTVFFYLNMLYAAVFRGAKRTKFPFFVGLVANVINVCLNYCLILGNFGFPQLGVQGAAIGTVISFGCATSMYVWMLSREWVKGLKLRLKLVRVDREIVRELVKIGVPAALDALILNAAFLSMVIFLADINEIAVAAHSIGLRVQSLAFVPGMSIAQATASLVGNALGGGSERLARQTTYASMIVCTIVMSTLAMLIIFFDDQIISVFNVQAGSELAELSTTWMHLLGYGMPVVGTSISIMGCLQGAGRTGLALRINALTTLMFQIPTSYVFGFVFDWGPAGVWGGFIAVVFLRLTFAAIAFRWADWVKLGVHAA